MCIDTDGNLLQALTPENESNPQLRRAQYQALDNGLSGKIACELVQRKIEAQLVTLKKHPELPLQERVVEIIETALKYFYLNPVPKRYHDVEFLMQVEATVANVYFEALSEMPIKWEKTIAPPCPSLPHVYGICFARGMVLLDSRKERSHVKPSAFDYILVDTLDEALSVLADSNLEAKVLAGGQSLLPMLNMRLDTRKQEIRER